MDIQCKRKRVKGHTVDMGQTLYRNLMDFHAHTALIMVPRFVVSDDAVLNVASRPARAWLLTTALTARSAEFVGGSAEAKLATADVQWALGARVFGVFSALGVSIAIAPAVIVG
jgi:hypothetical protein